MPAFVGGRASSCFECYDRGLREGYNERILLRRLSTPPQGTTFPLDRVSTSYFSILRRMLPQCMILTAVYVYRLNYVVEDNIERLVVSGGGGGGLIPQTYLRPLLPLLRAI